ncbi:hypothetical protein JTE90_016554 [Oedothorax gibbosus]|uniref:Uncharacterized protein n=1 Tax=Oedothorax gibbosus TaxID=931172 RepID=A0AAV6THE3_9ARAC|nr:hypothetical protein JTE90_016554 [Oedothorax gibbosus]
MIPPQDFEGPPPLPLRDFNSWEPPLFKFFATFPHGKLFAIGLTEVLALGGFNHPIKVALPSKPHSQRGRIRINPGSYGPSHPLWQHPGQGACESPLRDAQILNATFPTPLRAGIRPGFSRFHSRY